MCYFFMHHKKINNPLRPHDDKIQHRKPALGYCGVFIIYYIYIVAVLQQIIQYLVILLN